jgi:hypothetical protein
MDRFLLSRLLLIWGIPSIPLLLLLLGDAIHDSRRGIVSDTGALAPLPELIEHRRDLSVRWIASPETVSEIERAFATGICDPLLTERFYSHLPPACDTLRYYIKLDKDKGLYQSPYTYALFKKNQHYYYERFLRHNIRGALKLWAILSGAILVILLLPIALLLI